MHAPRLPAPPVPGGFGFPLGFVTTIVVMFAAVAAGATTHPEWSLIALACTTGSLACVSTLGAAVATAAVAWGLQAGFVLDRHGDLVLTPAATRDAIVLVAAALVAFIMATAIRTIRRRLRAMTIAVPVRRSAPAPSRIRPAWPTSPA